MNEEKNILLLIKSGYGWQEISNKLNNISYKKIKSCAIKNNIDLLLKINNNKYKRNRISELAEKKRNIIDLNIETLFGNKIIDLLSDEKTVNDINTILNIPKKQIFRFLKNKNLLDIHRKNSIKKIKMCAIKNGKLSAVSLKGIHLKPLTDEIRKCFIELKNCGKFKGEIKKLLKDKYGFGIKKYNQLCFLYGQPSENPQSGKLNPMYGKQSPAGSGIGTKGWVLFNGKYIFFRSLLELKIYLYLIDNKITFSISKHRIKYIFKKSERIYTPDICITNTIYEIKPHSLISNELVNVKMNALKKYCESFKLNCGFITENTYNLSKYDKEYILTLIEDKKIKILDEKNMEKLKRNL